MFVLPFSFPLFFPRQGFVSIREVNPLIYLKILGQVGITMVISDPKLNRGDPNSA
jgi:hypothetical protein